MLRCFSDLRVESAIEVLQTIWLSYDVLAISYQQRSCASVRLLSAQLPPITLVGRKYGLKGELQNSLGGDLSGHRSDSRQAAALNHAQNLGTKIQFVHLNFMCSYCLASISLDIYDLYSK